MVIYFLTVICFIGLIYYTFNSSKKVSAKKKLLSEPLNSEHLQIIKKNLPIYEKFLPEQQKRIEGLVNLFLQEITFTGCDGLEITDEIKVTIAAQASLLLLNNKTQPWYWKLHTVLVYPGAYKVPIQAGMNQDKNKDQMIRLGESWQGGTVVLAWNHSRHGGVNFFDGKNVVLHEFAHQLDQIDGDADGTPLLATDNCYASWANILSQNYKSLVHKTLKKQKTLLDKYGATNEAEFFSVATECFFEKPKKFQKLHPELFEQLKLYYGVNPLDWE